MSALTKVIGTVVGGGAAILLLGLAASASAQVTDYEVRVDGVSCPFCAYSLEKKLKNVVGVEDLLINIEEGVATLTPKEGQDIDIQGIPKAVEDAGFTPREIEVHARGRLETTTTGAALVALDGRTLLVLKANDMLARFTPGDGRMYEISGTLITGPKDGQPDDTPVVALVTAVPTEGA